MTVAERRVEQGNLAPEDDAAAPVGDYDDPTAVLAGVVGRQPGARRRPCSAAIRPMSTSRRSRSACAATIEPHVVHRLRGVLALPEDARTPTPRSCAGTARSATSPRWPGTTGREYGVEHGDVVEATIIGNVIKGYINGREVISVTDDVVKAGAPGVGFNFFVSNTNVDHGFSSFEVDTWDD